jgi:chromosome segregation ATPase
LTIKAWLHERDQKLNITELQNSALQNEQANRIRALEREFKDIAKDCSRLEITKLAKDKELYNTKASISNLDDKISNLLNDISNLNNNLNNKNSIIENLNKKIRQ